MTDLEGFVKHLIKKGNSKNEIIMKVVEEYAIYKDFSPKILETMAEAVWIECQNSLNAVDSIISNKNSSFSSILQEIVKIPYANVSMGQGGVGCRGHGDFFVHDLLAKLSQISETPLISPQSLDDTGAVSYQSSSASEELIILSKMEGVHSRLSDYPFLAGFHVTRAALRDIYVKGGLPISLMVDVHLADDGDIGKLFDFQAGIAAVAELAHVPITAGSTLRIGGDMVIGDRLTGGIAGIGIMKYSLFRKYIQQDDVIIMTEGAGGGTIATTALYSNHPEVLMETMNIKFLHACELLFQHPELFSQIHTMTDVTNGGLRGDLFEIQKECGYGVRVKPYEVRKLINSQVLTLLEQTGTDFLGVSLDALLIFCKSNVGEAIISLLSQHNIQSSIVGHVTKSPQVIFENQYGEEIIVPRFRESAYTPLKKIVDQSELDSSVIQTQIHNAFLEAQKKRESILAYLQKEP